MARVGSELMLGGEWLYHRGDFGYRAELSLSEVQAMCKSGGALSAFWGFDDPEQWQRVTLPHDALCDEEYDLTEDSSGGYKKRICCWYKKSFTIEEACERAELIFDGVLGKSDIYVNGALCARNFSGYNRFSCDIAPYITVGENSLAVYVDPRQPEGWWCEGVGIYRPVRLRLGDRSYIAEDDCFVRGRWTSGRWLLDAELAVSEPAGATLEVCLKDKRGECVCFCTVAAEKRISLSLTVGEVESWSPERAELYFFEARLMRGGKLIDEFSSTVGFRRIEWRADSGMLLCGKPYKIKGICVHQDHAGVGAAVTPEIEEYRIIKLKELGCNAYRCVHHAPSESLLEICDRLGMLVMVENRHFSASEEALSQLDALVRISRNHPSVFLYCLFNEEPWQEDGRGYKIAKILRERVRALDPTRATVGSQNHGLLNDINASDALDIIGVNYALGQYESIHARSPERVILGTENSPTYATRGCGTTDKERQIFADDGESYPNKFAEPLHESLDICLGSPYVGGCFVFSGFDYRGEPHPYGYPSVGSHWGMLDSCGFEKNIFYLLRCSYKDELILKLCVLRESGRVIAITNGEAVELFCDGVSLGEVKPKNNKAEWKLLQIGELSAIARRGDDTASDRYISFGKVHALGAVDETPAGYSGGARIIKIMAVDKSGRVCEDFSKDIKISLTKGRILGVGNGNPNGHFKARADIFPLFCGLGQVILSADSEGLSLSFAE